MTEKITRWLFGTAKVRVSGDTARFINVAVKSGAGPLELCRDGADALLTIRARDFKKLHRIKIRTHTRVRLVKKSGGPFLLRRLLRRPGLVLGAALGAALFVYLSGFYWGVGISGEAPYSKSELLAAAERCGAYIGASKKELDTALASSRVMRELPRLSWASLNTEGCFITLNVRASLEKEQGASHEGAYDVVASRAGLVRKITAESGTVLVEVGSAVAEGQVLVSGVTEIGDPWGEEPLRHLLSHARAEVIAETRHTFTASCPLKTESVREIPRGERHALYVLGVRIPISLSGAPKADRTACSSETLTLLGTELPVRLETLRAVDLEPETVEFTEEEARRRALEEVRQLEEFCLGETGELLSEEIDYWVKDGVVYASAACVCLENIAQEVSLTDGQ
ncbi:MAG: sporulation protein YqfD [Hominenteromicrobium sp.]